MLLNHPLPYPDEAWSSWLWRLAQRNYVASPHELLPSTLSQTTIPYEPVVFRALAELTNTSVETLHAHTLHRFAHFLSARNTPDGIGTAQRDPFDIGTLSPNRDFFTPRFGWCPTCLREARYVRLHWHVPLVVGCALHACWLLEACPVCTAPIREAEVLRGRCSHCGLALDEARSVSFPLDDVLLTLQREILAWLYHPEQSQLGLPHVPVGVLLRVLYGLRFAAQRAGDDWELHYVPVGIPKPDLYIFEQRSLTVVERGCLYAALFVACSNGHAGSTVFWMPTELVLRPVKRPDCAANLAHSTFRGSSTFGNIPPLTSSSRHSMTTYLSICLFTRLSIRPCPRLSRTARPRQLSGFEANRAYLGISVKGVYRLVEEGHLTAHRFPEDLLGVWFARDELEGCKRRWNQHLPFLAVVQQLGLRNH